MKKIRLATLIGLTILLLPAVVSTQSYTLTPTPFQTAFDNAGSIINNACIWTYTAGTSTPITTYSDSSGTPNTNPIRSDSAGRFTAYLVPATSYKFVYESACVPPAHGTTLRTADNILGTPVAAANVDITGTAGEAISLGNCVYLSDGSGSKTAGQWFKCDSANPYSATTPEVGIAPAAIVSASTGTIRLAGQVSNLSSLSVGAEYFVGTAGALTATAPGNRRHLGHADSATTFVLTGDPPPPALPNLDACGLHLTLTSGTAYTTADVTAATTVYIATVKGGQCAFYDGTSAWTTLTNAEASVAVPATTSTPFDVWCRNNSGTIACDTTNWTSDTARATATALQNNVLVKSGDTTRRYIGTARTTTVSGQTEDSAAKRYVWSYYNRKVTFGRVIDGTDSFTYSTGSYQAWNASAANAIDLVVGIAEAPVDVTAHGFAANSAGNPAYISIGYDSTTTPTSGTIGQGDNFQAAAQRMPFVARLLHYPAVGRHTYTFLQKASGGTTTWYGDNADGTQMQSGIQAVFEK